MKPIKALHIPLRMDRKVELSSREGLFQVGKILQKPVLEIENATIEHMGIPAEGEYIVLVVMDADVLYLYREKKKGDPHAG